ncbi:LysR substrate-binding domain-containing protein [Vibrio sp.]|uniref:LysR substrate-binding domain-containing protein n=1 Tax=Vibrio sp. TaxID=678 RepID=UPI003D0A9D4A
MKRHYLNGLNLICIVAEAGSLTRAAAKVHLTTGAISQQLLSVEQLLGFSVFQRHSRGVELTELGQQLVEAVKPHLEAIDDNVKRIQGGDQVKLIRLKLTPSFAFKWLVPRLEDFQRRFPDIQIQTYAEGALVDSDRRDFDVAVDYGSFPYNRPNAELLMAESLLPVMSPGYLAQHPELVEHHQGDSWQQVVLLHDAMPWHGAARDYEWQYWASQYHLNFNTNRGHFFNRTDMAMSAAEAGIGIALARMALLGDELDRQRLVSPFAPLDAGAGYFILTQSENDATRCFKQWLHDQAGQRS